MTSVMLATYPDVFAAGAIIAGLPYGVASNVAEAVNQMLRAPSHASGELGDLVRKASKHRTQWPRISVWHGSSDRTVNPVNGDEVVKQWLDVHRLSTHPMSENIIDGHPHQMWWSTDGETVVESYKITDMAHGTPLGKAENGERYGKEGPFLLDAGISSSYLIANFFGLTDRIAKIAKPASRTESSSAKLIPRASPLSVGTPDAEPKKDSTRTHDVGTAITRALTAAGLLNK
jgi:poly(3-hydroxybutyrate) depolymerase